MLKGFESVVFSPFTLGKLHYYVIYHMSRLGAQRSIMGGLVSTPVTISVHSNVTLGRPEDIQVMLLSILLFKSLVLYVDFSL